ncbi:50S ribosomal protein L1 [Metamycoplasma salivarium]|jgi:ribosomal protein L1|uniref:Large ribosomal subunit protein uL1 n=2 Tax=Metamycoplasma salivarium TaxID=2124 RepID=A0A448ZYF6_METSV|nr:50S ribosomal protein L1 [Metamycoplasma salivarium]CAD7361096.1 50S ribosomal protein L1 [Metamycoplasma salivarium]VEU56292.1 50S ribosomal protein L1 [Metamycoplasma salivarium]GIZ05505.1 50S ribosomal protein L1 [Metamycoplasma salivarium]GIZ06069.1 50S ribosomal protein L1 [Metamycoplasma salivarium]GIZ06706.1 50S ribosomal protein L1 [Metamycoplasma salivarium]
MARKLSKNVKIAKNLTSKVDILPLQEAIDLAKKASFAKFDESLDIAINLNLDTRKSDQQLRGAVVLPNGNGKSVRVLVATDDVNAQKAAKAAGADLVYSAAELPEILNQDKYEFDVIVADPKMMLVLGKYGKKLGPKGLMPNPKTGTVTTTPAKAVEELKKGKANYRADKGGIIHSSIGKKSMDTKKLTENAEALIQVIKRLKPTTVKGTYVKNITVSTSMGPSVKVKID